MSVVGLVLCSIHVGHSASFCDGDRGYHVRRGRSREYRGGGYFFVFSLLWFGEWLGSLGFRGGKCLSVSCEAGNIYSRDVRFSVRSGGVRGISFINKYGNGLRKVSRLIRKVSMSRTVSHLRKVRYKFGGASYPSRLTRTLGRTAKGWLGG